MWTRPACYVFILARRENAVDVAAECRAGSVVGIDRGAHVAFVLLPGSGLQGAAARSINSFSAASGSGSPAGRELTWASLGDDGAERGLGQALS